MGRGFRVAGGSLAALEGMETVGLVNVSDPLTPEDADIVVVGKSGLIVSSLLGTIVSSLSDVEDTERGIPKV